MNDETQIRPAQQPRATSVWQTLIDTLTSPREAFNSIAASPRALFPLLLVLASALAATAYYFSVLDISWWIDDTLREADITGDELEAAREAMGQMGRGMVFTMGALATVFFTALMILIQSVYISLAGAIMGSDYKFKHWFALVSWSSAPYMIGSLAMIVNVSLHPNGQLSSYSLDPTNLAALGLSIDAYEPIMRAITLPMLWSLALVVVGFAQWQSVSVAKSAAIMLAPYLIVLAISVSMV
jgi:hypothetical protein